MDILEIETIGENVNNEIVFFSYHIHIKIYLKAKSRQIKQIL